MATTPASAVEPAAAAPACAITRPATPIGITILDPDVLATAGLPPRVEIEDPAGELWFKDGGQAIYQPEAEGSSVVSFRYVADYATGSTHPATAYVLVNGSDPLPEGALDNPSLTAACSRAQALGVALAQPGAPVQPPEPGVRLDVLVDAFAGAKIGLLDAAFAPAIAKYLSVDGGVVVFLENGRVVFLAGADRTDLPQQPEYLLPTELGPETWDAAQLLEHAKGAADSDPGAPTASAELAANHVAFLDAPPAGASTVMTLARTELPFCGAEATCDVYEYQGSALIAISGTVAAALGSAAGELGWFAPGIAPLVVLAAAGPLDGLAATPADAGLAAYWLARDPDLSVVRIDGFFALADQPDPPDLSIGESRFVDAAALLQVAQPVVLPGFESADPVLRIPPSAFHARLEHGGGAGFSPYGAGGLEGNLVPLLEQHPTEPTVDEPAPERPHHPPVDGNRQPVANDDLAATFNDQPILLNPLANDFDPDPRDVIRLAGTPRLTEILAPEIAAAERLAGAVQTGPTPIGSATRVGHQILYVPDPEFEGTATISYVIRDDHGGVSAPATITVAVIDRGEPPGNQPPVAVDDTARTPLDTPVTIDVLANDSDRDDLPNSLLPEGEGLPLTIERIVDRPEHGTLERIGAGGDQELRYTPEPGFSGTDRFSYQVSDGLSPSDPGTVTIQVGEPEPPPPAAVDDAALAQVGGAAIAIDVLANDVGADLTIVALDQAALGEVEIAGGEVLYRPPAPGDELAPGPLVDQFSYAIGDGTVTALVTVDLNRAPEAADDLRPIEGRTLTIDVLANDGDLDGDPLTISALGPTQTGAEVEISADGRQILYTRPEGDAGDGPFSDRFDYTIDDGRGGVASATVTLFEGPDVPPLLTVAPDPVQVMVADDFDFPTAAPFPVLSEGRMLDPALINLVADGDLTLDVSRTVTLSFVSEGAGFHNSLGFYTLVDGAPTAPELIFPRVDDNVLTGGEEVLLGRFPADVELGLFLVQNGAGQLEGAPQLAFRPGTDGDPTLVRIDGGIERPVDAPVFFTHSALNGGAVQAIAGRTADDGLRIGFEDRVIGHGADGDYDDAVFEVRYGHVTGPGLDLAATIEDPDSATMARATVTIADGAPGDRLLLDGLGDGGLGDIVVAGEGTDALSFSGIAPAADYERLFEAVELEVDVFGGPRELVFQVFDDSSPAALPSNQASVTVDPVPASSPGADSGALLAGLIVPDQIAA